MIARNDFNTGLIVHGGEADQNLVLLDGYPIHNPFHLGGLFGTFIDATVGRIELMRNTRSLSGYTVFGADRRVTLPEVVARRNRPC